MSGDIVVARRPLDDEAVWDAALAGGRAFADMKVHGSAPAPYRALDLVAAARTASPDEAFAAEDDAIADLTMGDELRAGLYSFDLVQRRAKRPVGVPDKSLARPVTKVGVETIEAHQSALVYKPPSFWWSAIVLMYLRQTIEIVLLMKYWMCRW